MGKETKIGLAVLGVLLVGLGGALAMRLMNSAAQEAESSDVSPPDRGLLAAFREKSGPFGGNAETPRVEETPSKLEREREQWTESSRHAPRPESVERAAESPADPATAAEDRYRERYGNRSVGLDPAAQNGADRYQTPLAENNPSNPPADGLPGNPAAALDPFHREQQAPPGDPSATGAPPSPAEEARHLRNEEARQIRMAEEARSAFNPEASTPVVGGPGEATPLDRATERERERERERLAEMAAREREFREGRAGETRPGVEPAPLRQDPPDAATATQYLPSSNGGNASPAASPAQYDIYGRDVSADADPPGAGVPPNPSNFEPRSRFQEARRDLPDSLPERRREWAANGAETYTVAPNDNFWIISQKVYGTGAYFKALEEHNREQFPYSERLRAGDVVAVPPPKFLESKYPDLSPKSRTALPEGQATMTTASLRGRAGQARIYKVQKGDTLFDIARYELGKASRWAEIYELNRDQLGDDYDFLSPGMELALPDNRTPSNDPLTTQSRQPYNR